MPQYNLGHSGRRATIEHLMKDLPGLYLAGAAWGGVGIPDCIASGQNAASKALDHLQTVGSNAGAQRKEMAR